MLPSPPVLKTTIIQLNKELENEEGTYEILSNEWSKPAASAASANAACASSVGKKKRRRSSANVDSEELAKRKHETKQLHSIIEKRRRIKINREFEALKYLIPACRSSNTDPATPHAKPNASNNNKIDGMYKLTILKSSVEYILYLHHIVQQQHELLQASSQDYSFDVGFAKIPLDVNQYRNIDKEVCFRDFLNESKETPSSSDMESPTSSGSGKTSLVNDSIEEHREEEDLCNQHESLQQSQERQLQQDPQSLECQQDPSQSLERQQYPSERQLQQGPQSLEHQQYPQSLERQQYPSERQLQQDPSQSLERQQYPSERQLQQDPSQFERQQDPLQSRQQDHSQFLERQPSQSRQQDSSQFLERPLQSLERQQDPQSLDCQQYPSSLERPLQSLERQQDPSSLERQQDPLQSLERPSQFLERQPSQFERQQPKRFRSTPAIPSIKSRNHPSLDHQLPSPEITPNMAPVLSMLSRYSHNNSTFASSFGSSSSSPLLHPQPPSTRRTSYSTGVSPFTKPLKSTLPKPISTNSSSSSYTQTAPFSLPDPAIPSDDVESSSSPAHHESMALAYPRKKIFRSKIPANNVIVQSPPRSSLPIDTNDLDADGEELAQRKLSEHDASKTLLALRKSSIDNLLN